MSHLISATVWPCALLVALASGGLGQHDPAKKADAAANGKTIVCLGDSITRAGYPAILEKLLGVPVINAGIGGDTTRKALKRLDEDVLPHRPAAVVILFGANDSRQDAPGSQVPVDEYGANLGKMVDACRALGAKVLLGTMPPIDPGPYYQRHPKEKYEPLGGLERIVESYRSAALKLAKEKGIRAIDLNGLLAARPEWMNPDGVHPSPRGNEIIAELVAHEVSALLVAAGQSTALD